MCKNRRHGTSPDTQAPSPEGSSAQHGHWADVQQVSCVHTRRHDGRFAVKMRKSPPTPGRTRKSTRTAHSSTASQQIRPTAHSKALSRAAPLSQAYIQARSKRPSLGSDVADRSSVRVVPSCAKHVKMAVKMCELCHSVLRVLATTVCARTLTDGDGTDGRTDGHGRGRTPWPSVHGATQLAHFGMLRTT